ncbi:MAG TPA: hypothetical protein ENI52_05015 [Thermoplasmata archaeon]|nr:hypothetical protein [Thermoplasmata archaeon]
MKKAVFIIGIFILSSFSVNSQEYYHEKIEINFPDEMKFQPVDIHINFGKPCYAINGKKHSIKVLYNGKEIESQIYNLEFKGENEISSCNIVFLYQGKGEYIVRYGKKIEDVNYKDHVEVEDKYYYAEPIPGYFAKLNYYEVREEGKSIMGICQEGSVLGIEMSNKIIKVRENKENFEMKNWEQIVSFALFSGEDVGSDEKFLKKSIIEDGNLMVRLLIESYSNNKNLKTKAIYTYYYSPSNEKRLFVKLEHEAYENLQGGSTYAYIMSVKARSKTIEELNMGEIFPYIHLNGENGIEEYKIETNPESKNYKWIISAEDNVSLGYPAWISSDDKDRSYSLIFSENNLDVRCAVKEEVGVPGLEIDGGGVSIGKNEKGMRGIVYNGTVEFFYGKYSNIETEANAFISFKKFRNFIYYETKEKEMERHNLSVIVHLRNSFPFSSYISAFFGIRLPYIEAEIWNEEMVAKGTLNFRKISFEVPEGKYVIKIYYNILNKRKFIGEKSVDLKEDKVIHILCTFEGFFKVKSPEKSKIRIVDKAGYGIVYENLSNGNHTIIPLPSFHGYTIQIIYKGFLMREEEIFLPIFLEREYDFDLYNVYVKIKDKLGMNIGVNVSAILKSDEMIEDFNIEGIRNDGNYFFEDIPEGTYSLIISYKGFKFEKQIDISKNENIEIVFPVEYKVSVKTYDSRGFPIKTKILFERNGEEFNKNILPPAEYEIKIYDSHNIIANKKIFLINDAKYEIATKKTLFYPYIFPLLVLILFLFNKKIEALIAIPLSISLIFPWWQVKGNTLTNLYIFPPKMIEFLNSKEFYGSIIPLPDLVDKLFMVILIFLIISVILISAGISLKISLTFFVISFTTFIYSLKRFVDVTMGSIFGKEMIDGVSTKWHLGLGFYLALASLILIILKVVLNEIRRSS